MCTMALFGRQIKPLLHHRRQWPAEKLHFLLHLDSTQILFKKAQNTRYPEVKVSGANISGTKRDGEISICVSAFLNIHCIYNPYWSNSWLQLLLGRYLMETLSRDRQPKCSYGCKLQGTLLNGPKEVQGDISNL